MKKGIFTLLGVLALAMAFTGCGESDGAYSSSSTSGDDVAAVAGPATTEEDVKVTTFTNEYGINPSLGTPPAIPAN